METTNGIPICPKCKEPTVRCPGMSTSTAMYYPPIYDKNGINTNPDRNTTTTDYNCECGHKYVVSGNETDGYEYIN